MAVKSSVTHKFDIPHEVGEWMEFKELGWRTLEAAREAKTRVALMNFRDLGPEFLRDTQKRTEEAEAKPAEPAKEDVSDTFDMSILLRSSIIAWSYPEPCNEANIDELDARTARWAMKMIAEIHFPTEDEVGKATGA